MVKATRSAASSLVSALVFMLGLLTWMLARPRSATAFADCGKCSNSGTDPFTTDHEFGSFFGQRYDCNAFNACHSFSQPYSCGLMHFDCGSAMLLLMTKDALAREDGSTLEELLRNNSSHLTFIRSRHEVVLTNCTNKTIATLVVPSALEIGHG